MNKALIPFLLPVILLTAMCNSRSPKYVGNWEQPKLKPIILTIDERLDSLLEHVVKIITISSKESYTCSGVQVQKHYILTAKHCISPSAVYIIQKYKGAGVFLGTLVGAATNSDIALLHSTGLTGQGLLSSQLATELPFPGQQTLFAGNPKPLSWVVLPGVFYADDLEDYVVHVSGRAWFGLSGGGCFTNEDTPRLFGIVSQTWSTPMVVCVSIYEIRKLLILAQ